MATPTNEEIRDAVSQSAFDGIESVMVDGMTVREMKISDRLEALKELEATEASSKSHFGLRVSRLIPAPPG